MSVGAERSRQSPIFSCGSGQNIENKVFVSTLLREGLLNSLLALKSPGLMDFEMIMRWKREMIGKLGGYFLRMFSVNYEGNSV